MFIIMYLLIYFTDISIKSIIICFFLFINIVSTLDFFINNRIKEVFFIILYISISSFTIGVYFYFNHYPYQYLFLISLFLILIDSIKISLKWHNIILFLTYVIFILYYNITLRSLSFVNNSNNNNSKINTSQSVTFRKTLLQNKQLLMCDSMNVNAIKSELLQTMIEIQFEHKDDTINVKRSEFIQMIIIQKFYNVLTESDFNKIDSTSQLIR